MGMEGKTVAASRVSLAQVMLPEDTNPAGNVHGGTIMKLVDNAAFVVASRHCRRNVVTVSMDSMSFHSPVYLGDLLFLKASVNMAGKTSMEVGVKVESEDTLTGEVRHTGSAYLTFVALDHRGKPARVPPVIPETADEKRRYSEALQRAARRKETIRKD